MDVLRLGRQQRTLELAQVHARSGKRSRRAMHRRRMPLVQAILISSAIVQVDELQRVREHLLLLLPLLVQMMLVGV